jgi:hypothetical protein
MEKSMLASRFPGFVSSAFLRVSLSTAYRPVPEILAYGDFFRSDAVFTGSVPGFEDLRRTNSRSMPNTQTRGFLGISLRRPQDLSFGQAVSCDGL